MIDGFLEREPFFLEVFSYPYGIFLIQGIIVMEYPPPCFCTARSWMRNIVDYIQVSKGSLDFRLFQEIGIILDPEGQASVFKSLSYLSSLGMCSCIIQRFLLEGYPVPYNPLSSPLWLLLLHYHLLFL